MTLDEPRDELLSRITSKPRAVLDALAAAQCRTWRELLDTARAVRNR